MAGGPAAMEAALTATDGWASTVVAGPVFAWVVVLVVDLAVSAAGRFRPVLAVRASA